MNNNEFSDQYRKISIFLNLQEEGLGSAAAIEYSPVARSPKYWEESWRRGHCAIPRLELVPIPKRWPGSSILLILYHIPYRVIAQDLRGILSALWKRLVSVEIQWAVVKETFPPAQKLHRGSCGSPCLFRCLLLKGNYWLQRQQVEEADRHPDRWSESHGTEAFVTGRGSWIEPTNSSMAAPLWVRDVGFTGL